MRINRGLGLLVCAAVSIIILGCGDVGGSGDDAGKIHLTITDGSDSFYSDLTIRAKDYYLDRHDLDIYVDVEDPTFPLEMDLEYEQKVEQYCFDFELCREDGISYDHFYKVIDTSGGGDKNLSFEIPGRAVYTDWADAGVLVGGADEETAVELPAQKSWYRGGFWDEKEVRWYKAGVTPFSSYFVSFDREEFEDDGSGSYSSRARIDIYDEDGERLTDGSVAYDWPLYVFTDSSTIFIKITESSTMSGAPPYTYALGFAEADL
jgi:hypothetical protein